MLTLLNPHRFPPPFAPDDIGGLAQWFDPSDPDSVTLNGAGVSQLADRSGNGDHATQPNASEQPTLGAINGRTALSFSGANQELDLPDPDGITGSQNRSLFVVFQNANVSGNRSLISYGDDATGRSFHLATRGPSNKFAIGTWVNDYNSSTLSPGTGPHVGAVILDGTTVNDCILYLDGAAEQAIGVPTAVNTGTSETRIGSVHGNNDMNGFIGEILLYNSALSEADRQKVEGYLAHRWGLAESLEAGHPYKSTVP